MSLNGNDAVMISDSSKTEDMITFLEVISKENPGNLCIVLDNARIHHAELVKKKAEELNIRFIYLPPYSPDLNPIEFGWKDLKKELNVIPNFDKMVERIDSTSLKLFYERKYSYADYWIDKFISAEN